MKRTMKCRGVEPGQTRAQLTLLLGGGRGADHRASRPPGFLESCRKCLWGKMSVGGCCPPAGLEVGGLVGLEVWPPSLPALPPGPYTLCSLSSPPRPSLELAVSTVRAWGLRKGSALWAAQAAAGDKPESPRGGPTQVGARAIGTVSGCCGCRRGRVRVPKLFARKPSFLSLRMVLWFYLQSILFVFN